MNVFAKRKLLFLLVSCAFFAGMFFSSPARAQTPTSGLLAGITCISQGNCSPEDILKVLVNAMQMILGVVGSLMLAMFVWGGFQILLSAGKSDMIEHGKTTIVNAVIGMALVFGAWLIVNTITNALLTKGVSTNKDIRLDTKGLIETQKQ